MDEAATINLFAEGSEAEARGAFEALCPPARRFGHHLLRCSLPHADDREDIIQEALGRLWKLRARFEARGVGAWYRLLQRTLETCRIDWLRANRNHLTEEPLTEELAESETEAVEWIDRLAAAEQHGGFRHLADVVWLGLDPRASPAASRQRLLAAQLHLIDGVPLAELPAVLGGQFERTGDRHLADLQQRDCLLHLAFHVLHYSRDTLAAVLLGRDREDTAALDALAGRASNPSPDDAAPAGWSWAETSLILWRYRHALLLEAVLARRDCELTRTEAEAVIDRTRERFPFVMEMARLLERYGELDGVRARKLLAEPGLWRRLAFEYYYCDDLPVRDVEDRLTRAAERVDFTLTWGMLNAWLSGRRLVLRLAQECERPDHAV